MEPLKMRPFRLNFSLPVGFEIIDVAELITAGYQCQFEIEMRRKIMQEHPYCVLGASNEAIPAIHELYRWLLPGYLPNTFPGMFHIRPSGPSFELHNRVTGSCFPVIPPPDPLKTLETIGNAIQEDVLFLLPYEYGANWALMGFVHCYANGLNTRNRMYYSIHTIHPEIPDYESQMAIPMIKFMDQLNPNQPIRRHFWALTENEALFSPDMLPIPNKRGKQSHDVDVNKIFVRCEQQTFLKLPETEAVLLFIRSSLYPLSGIKHDGLGEELANGIDGLRSCNDPHLFDCRVGEAWAKPVTDYLRAP